MLTQVLNHTSNILFKHVFYMILIQTDNKRIH